MAFSQSASLLPLITPPKPRPKDRRGRSEASLLGLYTRLSKGAPERRTFRQRRMTNQPAAATKAGRLLWSLLEDPLAPVRTSAAFALAQVRDPSLVQAFILALEGASSQKMAKAAVTLGEAGYVNAVPYFAA